MFAQMRAERRRFAAKFQAEGERDASRIRAEASLEAERFERTVTRQRPVSAANPPHTLRRRTPTRIASTRSSIGSRARSNPSRSSSREARR